MASPAIAFGPVPSRRLGRSLGINNVPPKHCSYGCVYCQVGPTEQPTVERAYFYDPERIAAEVASRLRELLARDERVDMLTFVSDGEPTLDRNLGLAIEQVRTHGIPVAVITNGTLLGRADVRTDLAAADWVSVKVDTTDEAVWRKLNRPHAAIALADVLAAEARFASEFRGTLATDTMLVRGLNDSPELVRETAAFVAQLAPARAFLGIPTRPTAEPSRAAPEPAAFERALREFAACVPIVEPLTGHGEQGYGLTGDLAADLKSIAAVHPMREQEILQLLAKAQADRQLLDGLVASGDLAPIDYRGERFYVHRPPR